MSKTLVAGTVVFVALTLSAAVSALHQGASNDPLSPLEFLVGRWESTSEGEPGTGAGHRTYTKVLGGSFIEVRNRTVYPPQEKNPKGETHEDAGMFSFDKARKRMVFRQFHREGFVNQYLHEDSKTPGDVVFVTEAIENIPTGWRARETYRLLASGDVEEIFELAEPGKEFAVYSRNRLRRAP